MRACRRKKVEISNPLSVFFLVRSIAIDSEQDDPDAASATVRAVLWQQRVVWHGS
jgi:hypothetical protein